MMEKLFIWFEEFIRFEFLRFESLRFESIRKESLRKESLRFEFIKKSLEEFRHNGKDAEGTFGRTRPSRM